MDITQLKRYERDLVLRDCACCPACMGETMSFIAVYNQEKYRFSQ